MSAHRSGLDLRFLVAAFAAVAVTFVGATAVTARAIRRIDAASDEIAFNSAPSIQRLAAVRTAARHAAFLLGTAVTLGDPMDRAAVEPALAVLNSEANAYLALPTFPGEKEFWRDLNDSIAAFNGAVQRTLAEYDTGATHEAHAGLPGVRAAADRVSAAAARALDFNARNGRELALRIKAVRRESTVVGYALNALCVVFAGIAALLVARQVRRYGTLLEAHAALQEARATELESFAGRAAHDILNPISTTQMALALVVARDLQDPRTRELVDRAVRNLHRVRSIIDGLLQFARAGARPTGSDTAQVHDVIEDVTAGVRPRAEAAGIELRIDGIEPCEARCSVGVLTSIVSNLAHNAIKYMDGGRGVRRITLRAERRADMVHVEVEDSGPGIPRALLGRVFEPFVRGPTGGTDGLGLGLATVRRLCEAHGGRVGVRSVVGEGSVFWIELPTSSAPASAGASPTSPSPADARDADFG